MVHPPPTEVDVGTVLGGTYQVTGLLGRGGMGAVFAADHVRLPGKRVAIKVLLTGVGEEAYIRFRREAEIASRIGHPNIVQVLDWNTLPSGAPYLVLEYLEGESLAARLSRGPVHLDEALSIVRQIGSALSAAHRAGVVHRDLKPENIMLVPTDSGGTVAEQVKVLDFGISKIKNSTTLQTQEAKILGTPQYMAPEQASGKNQLVDHRTDVFALGAIVYEMLCGSPAFQGDNLAQVVFKVVFEEPTPLAELAPYVPANVIASIEKALSKDPAGRYDDIGAFISELTGRPLATLGMPAQRVSSPTTRQGVRTGEEAYAATVTPPSFPAGSVANADSPVPTGRKAQASIDASLGTAGTLAADIPPPPRAAQITAQDPPPTISDSKPPSKIGKLLLFVALVAVAAVGGTIVVMKVTQRKPTASSASETPPDDPDPRPPKGNQTVPIDDPTQGNTKPVDLPTAQPPDAGAPAKAQAPYWVELGDFGGSEFAQKAAAAALAAEGISTSEIPGFPGYFVDGTIQAKQKPDGTVDCTLRLTLATRPDKSLFDFVNGGASVTGDTDLKVVAEKCAVATIDDTIVRQVATSLAARSGAPTDAADAGAAVAAEVPDAGLVASATPDAAPTAADTSTPDAGVKVAVKDEKPKPKDEKPKPKDDKPKPKPKDDKPKEVDKPEEEEPSEVKADLDAAKRALDSGNTNQARRLARHALQTTKRNPRAYAIITMAYCLDGDLGNAKGTFHSAGRMRGKVKRFCLDNNVDLSD